MNLRMNYHESNPEAFQAMLALERFASSRGIDDNLYHLIKTRASQLNGCSFCVDMHAKSLLESGESLDRIVLLSVWREAPVFTPVERAVLELTECVTLLAEKGVPQEVYDAVRAHFDEKAYVDLIMAINAINCWNRLGVSTGMFPGCMIKA